MRPKGQAKFGTRREIKNLNSFRFLEQAINYEVDAQIEIWKTAAKYGRQPCCSTLKKVKPA